ncbi:MAG: HAD family hydrolase [Planctomycetaceae bacterium]|jgi:phosphoglycolate phosphatase-like HAD superfamily hydrolase|nr:HAD family hydrolase [Planctomycetaceae bacterium]
MLTLEIVRQPRPTQPPKAAILDFDGTISLIREGWQQVMIPLFIEVLAETSGGKNETPKELEHAVREFVDLLTGKQTIYQCIQLAEEVTKRNGTPLEPLAYKHEYHRRLLQRIHHRLDALKTGGNPQEHLVPGSYDLLQMLRQHGLTVYLASGTDEVFVKEEADLLRVTDYFNGGVYGAQDDHKTFSKAMVIQRIIAENKLQGQELIGFGDGYVEIENVHDIGGFAVGVATNESERSGIDDWKRNRLIGAGADLIIPDYSDIKQLESQIFGEEAH